MYFEDVGLEALLRRKECNVTVILAAGGFKIYMQKTQIQIQLQMKIQIQIKIKIQI